MSNPLDVFNALERLVRDAAAGSSAGGSGRWEEIEKAWVLSPTTTPRGVVHFCGGAFVGASPQLSYRLFLETLSAKTGCVIVATPYVTSFDHLRVADEAQFTFDRASRALASRLPPDLPVWGMGHSMGALAQCLISSRYAVARSGNVLLSFNNKPATDAIPLFVPVVSPLMQGLSPLLSGYATSPLRGGLEALSSQLRGAAPPLLRELLPLLDQLEPLTLDVAAGRCALPCRGCARACADAWPARLAARSSRPRPRRRRAWCARTTPWRERFWCASATTPSTKRGRLPPC